MIIQIHFFNNISKKNINMFKYEQKLSNLDLLKMNLNEIYVKFVYLLALLSERNGL